MRTVAALVFLLAAMPAAAQPPGHGGRPAGASIAVEPAPVASPDQIIRQGLDRLAGFLLGGPDATEQDVRRFVDLQIAPYFDFGYMARWAAGPLLHRLEAQHRAALATRLRTLFVDALARHLGALERPLPRVDVFPARPGRSVSEAVVTAQVLAASRPPLRLQFHFYWSRQGWKVFDTVANGASAAAFYRSYFTRLLRRHGPDALL